MTEDEQHKQSFIKVPKHTLQGDNRYKDILPCNEYLMYYNSCIQYKHFDE